jgi:hypothetical protein
VTEDQAIRASFGWAAIFALLPALLGLPTPDPGILFGIFAGVASSDLKLLAQRSSASPRFNLQVLPNRSGNLVGDS